MQRCGCRDNRSRDEAFLLDKKPRAVWVLRCCYAGRYSVPHTLAQSDGLIRSLSHCSLWMGHKLHEKVGDVPVRGRMGEDVLASYISSLDRVHGFSPFYVWLRGAYPSIAEMRHISECIV